MDDHIDTWKELEMEHGLRPIVADSDLVFKGFEVPMLLVGFIAVFIPVTYC